jgi:hypothetical protein
MRPPLSQQQPVVCTLLAGGVVSGVQTMGRRGIEPLTPCGLASRVARDHAQVLY